MLDQPLPNHFRSTDKSSCPSRKWSNQRRSSKWPMCRYFHRTPRPRHGLGSQENYILKYIHLSLLVFLVTSFMSKWIFVTKFVTLYKATYEDHLLDRQNLCLKLKLYYRVRNNNHAVWYVKDNSFHRKGFVLLKIRRVTYSLKFEGSKYEFDLERITASKNFKGIVP